MFEQTRLICHDFGPNQKRTAENLDQLNKSIRYFVISPLKIQTIPCLYGEIYFLCNFWLNFVIG